MCTATAEPSCGSPAEVGPGEEYISQAEASRRTGLHGTTLLRMAVAGELRTRSRGRRVLFSAEDLVRLD